MSQIADLLLTKAASYQSVADESSTVQSAAIATLVVKGLPMEKAASLVAQEFDDSTSASFAEMADVLTKAAAYVEELETKLAEAEAAKPIEKAAHVAEATDTLHTYGMTDADIERLPEDMLQKVASMIQTPFSMGEPSGMAADKTDPLTAWLLS